MSSSPLVSVIIPTFNRPLLLKEAIESVLNQKHPNFEILVINDGGEDVSSLLNEFQDSRILALKHESNKGVAAARNTGLKKAKGDYIAYLDDDDTYCPEHLSDLIESLKKQPFKAAHCDYYLVHKDWKNGAFQVVKKTAYPTERKWPEALIAGTPIFPLHVLIHERECLKSIGYFDETLSLMEDADFLIRLRQKYPFFHLSKPNVEYSHVATTRFQQTHAAWIAHHLEALQFIHLRYSELATEHDLLKAEKVRRDEIRYEAVRQLQNMPPEERKQLHPEKILQKILEGSIALGKADIAANLLLISQVLPFFQEQPILWTLQASASYLTEDTLGASISYQRALELGLKDTERAIFFEILKKGGISETALKNGIGEI